MQCGEHVKQYKLQLKILLFKNYLGLNDIIWMDRWEAHGQVSNSLEWFTGYYYQAKINILSLIIIR